MKAFKIITELLLNIWKNRTLMMDLTVQDFKRRFAGSYLGILWGFINPLLTMIVYWLVFQFGFRSGDANGVPFMAWFACGISVWLFFSDAFSTASNAFVSYSYLVKKVVFNINILPLVKIFSSLVVHLFFVLLVAIICSLFGYYPSLYLLQLPYYMLCAIALIFAISLVFASVMVFFRDLGQIINIILMIGMWGTPIAWNMGQFSDHPILQTILKLNPIFYLVDGYRDCFVQQTWFWEKGLSLYFWGLLLVLLLWGSSVYNRLKNSFADFL